MAEADVPLMPPHELPFKKKDVRDLYWKGTWAYALGKPAWTHPDYKKTVAIANKGRAWHEPFNPWWIRNWSDVHAVLDGCYFDYELALLRVEFTECVRLYIGTQAGKPITLADWQIYDIKMPMFGWQRRSGVRRFRRGLVEIPKKNAKTTDAAENLLYFLIADGEEGAEVYSAAVDQGQNEKIYDAVYWMGKSSPALRGKLGFIRSKWRVTHPAMKSFYQALSGKGISAEGKDIHALVEEELHVHPNAVMHDTLKHGGAARPQPFMYGITTAGLFDPTSIGYKQHEFALMVINALYGAERSWEFFGYVCGLDKKEEDRWAEPAMATKANPMMGITVKLEDDMEMCREAQAAPREVSIIKRYRRNIWVNALDAWMPREKWDACAAKYTEDDLEDLICYGGIDCSASEDISAFVLWFPRQGDMPKARILVYCWVPEERLPYFDGLYDKMYSRWKDLGQLLTTPGENINQEYIRKKIVELGERFTIRTIAYDKAFALKLAQDLKDKDGFDVASHGQGFSAMNEPTQALMQHVSDKTVEHNNHQVMNWHVSNAQAVKDAGDRVRIVKNWGAGAGKSRIRYKIDALTATIMANSASRLDDVGTEPEDMTVQWIG